jgi:hypothetical protein
MNCPVCKRSFAPLNSRNLYCSVACRTAAKLARDKPIRRAKWRAAAEKKRAAAPIVKCAMKGCENRIKRTSGKESRFCADHKTWAKRHSGYNANYHRAWRARNQEKIKRDRIEYREKDPERYRQQNAEWRKLHPESVEASRKRWNEIHKQRRRIDGEQRKREYEYRKRWRLKNPEKYRAELRRKAERLRQRRLSDPVWRAQQLARMKQLWELKKLREDYGERAARNVMRAKRYYERMKNDPEYQAKRRAYAQEKNREIQADPIRREAKNARAREWREKNPDRVRMGHAKTYYQGPSNPKGDLQWLRKNRAELRNLNRKLNRNNRRPPEASP